MDQVWGCRLEPDRVGRNGVGAAVDLGPWANYHSDSTAGHVGARTCIGVPFRWCNIQYRMYSWSPRCC